MFAFHQNYIHRTGIPVTAINSQNTNYIAHWHKDIELVYVCEGSLRVGINSECKVLSAGDIAICSSGSIHYFDNQGKSCRIILILFNPDFIDLSGASPVNNMLIHPFIDRNKIKSVVSVPDLADKFKNIFETCLWELENKHPQYPLMVKSKLMEFCSLIFRYFSDINAEANLSNKKLINIQKLQSVVDFLNLNYMKDLSLEDAAEYSGFSPYYFSRIFNSMLGMSFKTYLNHIRVENAKKFLQNKEMSVTDIALECGFESIRNFNRVFKALTGCTPSEGR